MQRLFKALLIFGVAIFIAVPSTASCQKFIHDHAAIVMKHGDDRDSTFWEKFRESVKPREEKPQEKPPVEKPPEEAASPEEVEGY